LERLGYGTGDKFEEVVASGCCGVLESCCQCVYINGWCTGAEGLAGQPPKTQRSIKMVYTLLHYDRTFIPLRPSSIPRCPGVKVMDQSLNQVVEPEVDCGCFFEVYPYRSSLRWLSAFSP